MTKLHNMSVEEIIADIESLRGELASNITEICDRLVELRRRKAGHPLMADAMFRHFDKVSSGRLIPAILWMTRGNKKDVELYAAQSVEVQKAVARGNDFTVAVVQNGEVVEERKPVRRMNKAAVERLFKPEGGVRTFSEQRDVLLKEIAERPDPLPPVRADTGSREVVVRGRRATLQEIKAALADLGLTLAPLDRATDTKGE